MKHQSRTTAGATGIIALGLLLSGCAQTPLGPTVQVMPGRLRFLNDHVLQEMVRKLGLQVEPVQAPFEPEGGAYGHHHAHGSQLPLIRPKIHEFQP